MQKKEVTRLLRELQSGSEGVYHELFDLVYNDLRSIAHSKLKREYHVHTWSKTALVHEVYLRMIDQDMIKLNDRNHFFAIASRCMRQILIDHARKKKAEKRGGRQEAVTYADHLLEDIETTEELLNIDQKLEELAQLNKRLSDIVELRFFGEMSVNAISDVLGISESTVKRDWAKARGWLYKELK